MNMNILGTEMTNLVSHYTELLDYILYGVYNRPVVHPERDASKSRNGAFIP